MGPRPLRPLENPDVGVGGGVSQREHPQPLPWAVYGKEHRLIAIELSGYLYLEL